MDTPHKYSKTGFIKRLREKYSAEIEGTIQSIYEAIDLAVVVHGSTTGETEICLPVPENDTVITCVEEHFLELGWKVGFNARHVNGKYVTSIVLK
jgi:hypothetical protein